MANGGQHKPKTGPKEQYRRSSSRQPSPSQPASKPVTSKRPGGRFPLPGRLVEMDSKQSVHSRSFSRPRKRRRSNRLFTMAIVPKQ